MDMNDGEDGGMVNSEKRTKLGREFNTFVLDVTKCDFL